MGLLEVLLLAAALLLLLYKWSTATYGTLRERGVPHDTPLPLLGTTELSAVFGKKSLMKWLVELHSKHRNRPVYGVYSMRDPFILLRDAELIKSIGIKDFDSFPNHRSQIGSEDEDLGRSLIALRDQQWKRMRNTLTPAFTGSKMRLMFELINECCVEAVKYLRGEVRAGGEQDFELEMRDFFTRFANDVIASAAFGIKVNSFEERDNEFFRIGNIITQFKGLSLIKSILLSLFPKLMKALKVSLLDQKNINYFNRLVLDAMRQREEQHIVRPDMIQLLMEAKKQRTDSTLLDDRDLVAQCLLFFFAGFDTIATCLCFTAHELMENPEVQQRLYCEVLEIQQQLDGRPLSYESLLRMNYMDMVLAESLRKWPPAMLTDRVCSKDYTLKNADGQVLAKLKKGDNVWIPIIALQRDPENFEQPDRFDPTRFSEENKHKIKPLTYLPFGVGPRNCIGNRMALMETKAIIYHLLLHFTLLPSPKSTKDMFNAIEGFQMIPKDGFWMKLRPRDI